MVRTPEDKGKRLSNVAVKERASRHQYFRKWWIARRINTLSLLLFHLLELLCEGAHGDKERVGPKLRQAWWWERASGAVHSETANLHKVRYADSQRPRTLPTVVFTWDECRETVRLYTNMDTNIAEELTRHLLRRSSVGQILIGSSCARLVETTPVSAAWLPDTVCDGQPERCYHPTEYSRLPPTVNVAGN